MDSNPLKQYFRQPAIYIKLPSEGRHYQPGALQISPNGEYPVLPMTTLDEITYRTPDALFNGSAVPAVIQSCMPNIKDAWGMPAMDIDTVLIAIRIATYGHEMPITTKCPKCETEADYGIDLRRTLESIGKPEYDRTLEIGDLRITLKPMTYKQINENSMKQFEDQKTMQMLQDDSIDDQTRATKLGEILKKITAMTTLALAENIAVVVTPQAQVTNPAHIAEWLANCDRAIFARVRDHILGVKAQAELQPLKIKCGNCSNEYPQPFTLDMSNFFGDAS